MTGELSWVHQDDQLILQGALDQNLLLPLWQIREQITDGVAVIDLRALTRIDTAGLALLVHFIVLIRRQGREVKFIGKSEKMQTLVNLYHLPADLIP